MAPLGTSKSAYSALIALIGVLFLLTTRLWSNWSPEPSKTLNSVISSVASLDEFGLQQVEATSTFVRRDDYTCGPGKPCANGACCGSSGYCGYGSTYCGTGCTSNCNATAECGQYASPAGKTCPLNVCCSQYGFCGTTSDFCTNACQSNCNANPTPSGATGQVLNKVIGYYESWSSRLSCHKMNPSDLPLQALTHLNYAFAYIDPSSFKIVTMDPQTPASLFQTTTQVKQYNPALKVFISIGGWTFSDNGTATQPVFGNIAASAANRQTFANNLVQFINQYGFDGVDLDWEYPGAPDRGGSVADTANYVALLSTLRSTFNSQSRTLGITFTAPSSYWYLRWFDLPNMVKYADWVNLMTYDLHGVWDRNNPIGSIVQGHTNLTEIKLALQLFWRVNIPPAKISMGFGFYGRSFQLSDPSCSTPGCAFSGGGAPGPCSGVSGILTYYEIMALINGHSGLTPVHDSVAAVNYLTYSGNNWVSYDDAVTFKQKVDWANSVGLGGALIWASDLDDANYSAHSGLLGKTVGQGPLVSNAFATNTISLAANVIGQNGQACFRFPSCVNMNIPSASSCGAGYTKIGYDDACCGGAPLGKPICCPVDKVPSSCTWRGGTGGGTDCNGQCHAGEATLFYSKCGGGFQGESGTHECNRGNKVFCCDAGDWNNVIQGCYWSGCGGSCKLGEDTVSTRLSAFSCTILYPYQQYCCPHPAKLSNCHWVGSLPDCTNATCATNEVAIDTNAQGDSFSGCSWGRKKSDCCQVTSPPAATCSKSMCQLFPYFCAVDDGTGTLTKRTNRPPIVAKLNGQASVSLPVPNYPSAGSLFSPTRLRLLFNGAFSLAGWVCSDTTVATVPIPAIVSGQEYHTEHIVDFSIIGKFVETANSGILSGSGKATKTAAIANAFWTGSWLNAVLPGNLPNVGTGSASPTVPNDRVFEALGSFTNPANFLLTDASINSIKGILFQLNAPASAKNFEGMVLDALVGKQSPTVFLQIIRTTIAVFNYANITPVASRFNIVKGLIRAQLVLIEANVAGAAGLTAMWDEFAPDYFSAISKFAQTWVLQSINTAQTLYLAGSFLPGNAADVLAELNFFKGQAIAMTLP